MCPLPVSPPPRYFSVSLTTSRSHSEVILSLWESFFLFSGDLTISLSEGRSGVVVGQFIYTPGREIQRACSRENVCMPQRTEQQPGAVRHKPEEWKQTARRLWCRKQGSDRQTGNHSWISEASGSMGNTLTSLSLLWLKSPFQRWKWQLSTWSSRLLSACFLTSHCLSMALNLGLRRKQ